MAISRKALTVAFILVQAVFLTLIFTNVLVVDNVRWVFFAIVFVYLAAMMAVGKPK